MDGKKKGKLHLSLILLITILIVAAFTLLCLGYYNATFVLFAILIVLLSFISNWTGTDSAVYLHKRNHKNHEKW
ncbi:MAG TPA: hypothetical protein VNS08_05660 [Ureibacillus sp.]|nr:hypothetical protein [Ureibacillus sp.]